MKVIMSSIDSNTGISSWELTTVIFICSQITNVPPRKAMKIGHMTMYPILESSCRTLIILLTLYHGDGHSEIKCLLLQSSIVKKDCCHDDRPERFVNSVNIGNVSGISDQCWIQLWTWSRNNCGKYTRLCKERRPLYGWKIFYFSQVCCF